MQVNHLERRGELSALEGAQFVDASVSRNQEVVGQGVGSEGGEETESIRVCIKMFHVLL